MLKNYLVVAFRNLLRQKAYSFLNIVGLAVGLACSITILLWVQDELGYDRFHQDVENIYYIRENQTYDAGKIYTFGATPGPLAEGLKNDFPEVKHAVRMNWGSTILFTYREKRFNEEGLYADPSFFEVFTFPVLKGDPRTALKDIKSVVLTEKLARKYFGNDDPIGKSIRINNKEDFRVTAVLQDVPQNSTIRFDFLMPFENYFKENQWLKDWGSNGLQTFLRLQPAASGEALQAKISGYVKKQIKDSNVDLVLQPLTRIHLYAEYKDGRNVGGRISYIRLFAVIAGFILVIACINFMNLATARSEKRSKEVGVRKVMGALREVLIRQFMGESLLTAVLALVLALVLVAVTMPYFAKLTGRELTINWLDYRHWLLFTLITMLTGVLAGSYPAFFLSSFNPVQVLKGTAKTGRSAVLFRRLLVVGQFFFSILLIIATLVVYGQISFLRNRDLGYSKDNLLMVAAQGDIGDRYENFKQELLQQPGVAGVTSTSQRIVDVGNSTGNVHWPGKAPETEVLFSIVNASYDFTGTFGMKLREGRDFEPGRATDSSAVLLNEEAAKRMNLKHPVGQLIKLNDRQYTVIGLVKDFHFNSVYSPVDPLIVTLAPHSHYIFVRIDKNAQLAQTVPVVEGLYRRFNPAYPFDYQFLDQEIDKSFKSEQQLGKLAGLFASLAVFISCLGLFGLAMFTAQQRRKEIGIRKVLGASVTGIVALLSKEFLRLVALAFLIAGPVAWYAAEQWLQGFTYRIAITWWVFAIAGGLALLIALFTVSFQSVKAALANPVKSLRSE